MLRFLDGMMIELNADTFPIVIGHGRVLVSWYRSGWDPWRAFAPIYQAAASRHPRVIFARVDAEREHALAAQCGISAIPTLMAFSGRVLVFSHVGFDIAESLDAAVARLRRARPTADRPGDFPASIVSRARLP
ncbi:MAG TPA: thioredoxin family protein [Kofleriaceae bacterium]|nr:thioredoxin family protein [Kofleriaceae bacterium]